MTNKHASRARTYLGNLSLRTVFAAAVTMALGFAAAAPAQATMITGDFTVNSSTPGILVSGAQGGALSDFGKTLNVDLSLDLTANTPVTTSLFGLFDISVSSLSTAFSNLSDGTAATSCTGSCTAAGGNLFNFIVLSPTSFDVMFADGSTLNIDDNFLDTYENYTFTLTPGTSGVPEPVSLSLFGMGLVGLALGQRRKKASKAS